MIPQIHLNFGPTSFDRFYQVLLPLIPGGLLTLGLLMTHLGLSLWMQSVLGLSGYAYISVLIFVAYTAGFLLFGASSILAGIVSGTVQSLVFLHWRPKGWGWLLSQSTIWRKVAARFLGEGLTPKIQENQAPTTVMEKLLSGMKDFANKQQEDALWEEWYRILQDYLLRDVPIISNDNAFALVGLQATGWAIVAVCFSSPYVQHWPVYLLASTFIIFGALFPFLIALSYLGTERLSYWDFTARLLAEVHARELSGTPKTDATAPRENTNQNP
jgi:hypothetical protein